MEFPQTFKSRTTIQLSHPIQPKETKTGYQRDICTPMFVTALFTIVKYGNNLGVHGYVNG